MSPLRGSAADSVEGCVGDVELGEETSRELFAPHAGERQTESPMVPRACILVEAIERSREGIAVEAELEHLARVVEEAATFEELAGAVLEALSAVTGLEATYVTVADPDGSGHTVRVARSPGTVAVREGDRFDWSDPCPLVVDVPAGATGSRAAPCEFAGVGPAEARTLLRVPIITAEGTVVGTLCGASPIALALDDGPTATAKLFARLLADRIARHSGAERHPMAQRVRAAEARAEAAEGQARAAETRRMAAERRAETAEKLAAGARQAFHDAVLRFQRLHQQTQPVSATLRQRLRSRREREHSNGDAND